MDEDFIVGMTEIGELPNNGKGVETLIICCSIMTRLAPHYFYIKKPCDFCEKNLWVGEKKLKLKEDHPERPMICILCLRKMKQKSQDVTQLYLAEKQC
jgi:hypothetical protein